MTIPPDAVLRGLDYDGLTALAEADPDVDVDAAIARQLELTAQRTSVTALRTQARDMLRGNPPTPDPATSPIAAHRAASAAEHAERAERRRPAQTPEGPRS